MRQAVAFLFGAVAVIFMTACAESLYQGQGVAPHRARWNAGDLDAPSYGQRPWILVESVRLLWFRLWVVWGRLWHRQSAVECARATSHTTGQCATAVSEEILIRCECLCLNEGAGRVRSLRRQS